MAYAPVTQPPALSFEALMAKYRRPAKSPQDDRRAAKVTPAMLEQAAASDMREAFPLAMDAEEAAAAGFHFAADCPADPALAQD